MQLQLQLQAGDVLHAGGARHLTRITHMDTEDSSKSALLPRAQPAL